MCLPRKKQNLRKNLNLNQLQTGEHVSYWGDIINNLKAQGKIMLYTNLMASKAKQINDLVVGIEFPNGLTAFGKAVLEKPENKLEIEKQITLQAGKQMQVRYLEQEAKAAAPKAQANPLEGLDIPINIIEE